MLELLLANKVLRTVKQAYRHKYQLHTGLSVYYDANMYYDEPMPEVVKPIVTPIAGAQSAKAHIPTRRTRQAANHRIPKGSLPLALNLAAGALLIKRLGAIAATDREVSAANLAVAMQNSLTSSSFVRKLSALRLYGLITETGSDTYSLSERGMMIAAPRSPQDEVSALKAAFLEIEPFNRIFQQHKGKLLPADEFLRNIIEHDCKIPHECADQWVSDFKQGAHYAALLHDRGNGRVQISENPVLNSDGTESQARPDSDKAPHEPLTSNPQPLEVGQDIVGLPLCGHTTRIQVSESRWALFYIPDKITKRDATKLKRALQGVAALIDSAVEDSE